MLAARDLTLRSGAEAPLRRIEVGMAIEQAEAQSS